MSKGASDDTKTTSHRSSNKSAPRDHVKLDVAIIFLSHLPLTVYFGELIVNNVCPGIIVTEVENNTSASSKPQSIGEVGMGHCGPIHPTEPEDLKVRREEDGYALTGKSVSGNSLDWILYDKHGRNLGTRHLQHWPLK